MTDRSHDARIDPTPEVMPPFDVETLQPLGEAAFRRADGFLDGTPAEPKAAAPPRLRNDGLPE